MNSSKRKVIYLNQKIHTEHPDMGYRRICDELDGHSEFM